MRAFKSVVATIAAECARACGSPWKSPAIFERTRDGRELEYGKVLVWEPPTRLKFAFYLGSGAEHPTHVDVRFVEIAGGTRVELVQELGDLSQEGFDRIAERFERSWSHVIERYGAYVDASSADSGGDGTGEA